jgi:3-hydroxyanthranilate 3,4-dioxygenase
MLPGILQPLNFQKWIEEHRDQFKPPVGNQQVWEDREFMITVVGGPNSRTDFHVNQGEEFFYQLEGNMILRILQAGKPVDIPINQGDIFLLPKNVPHSPQRPAKTLGLVIERKRNPGEIDSLLWICKSCHHQLYREDFHCADIVKDLLPVIDRFYASQAVTCSKCQAYNGKNG